MLLLLTLVVVALHVSLDVVFMSINSPEIWELETLTLELLNVPFTLKKSPLISL